MGHRPGYIRHRSYHYRPGCSDRNNRRSSRRSESLPGRCRPRPRRSPAYCRCRCRRSHHQHTSSPCNEPRRVGLVAAEAAGSSGEAEAVRRPASSFASSCAWPRRRHDRAVPVRPIPLSTRRAPRREGVCKKARCNVSKRFASMCASSWVRPPTWPASPRAPSRPSLRSPCAKLDPASVKTVRPYALDQGQRHAAEREREGHRNLKPPPRVVDDQRRAVVEEGAGPLPGRPAVPDRHVGLLPVGV